MRDAATRLGTGASGTADVMADGFFAPLDFALVMQRANPNPKPNPNPNPNPTLTLTPTITLTLALALTLTFKPGVLQGDGAAAEHSRQPRARVRARLGGRGMRHSDREWCGRRLWLAGLGGMSVRSAERGGGLACPHQTLL